MDRKLTEEKIKEVVERIKNEISDDKKVICEWHSNYADVSVVGKENSYLYFNVAVFDDGIYSLGHTYYNYQDILDDYFTDVNNLIDYREFKELLNIDKEDFSYFKMEENEADRYYELEKNFLEQLTKEEIPLIIHVGKITYSLHEDPKGNEWNLTAIIENKPTSDTRGSYRECIEELCSQVKYEDLLIELTRQDRVVNINNLNENGEKEGLWLIPKKEDWIKEDICYFENGKLNGKYAEIFKNNEVAEIGTYKDNVKEGESFSYYMDTLCLSEKKSYKGGVLNGEFIDYLHSGELLSKGFMKNGKLNGPLETYYNDENGNTYLWQKGEIKDGVENGNFTNFYPNGNIESTFTIVEGKLEGKTTNFYENGIIKSINNYKDSKLYGLSETYYKNGNLASKEEWENDFLNGKKTEYLESGGRFHESDYVKGTLMQERFYKEGQLESVKNYELGNLKEEKRYYDDLTLSTHLIYNKDETVTWKGYYPNGNLQFENTLKDNLFFESSKLYYENGNLMESSNYIIKDDKALKDGEFKAFNEDGTLKESCIYKEGNIIEKPENSWEDKLNNDFSDLER